MEIRNLPSPFEKLTDSTLPLNWPPAYWHKPDAEKESKDAADNQAVFTSEENAPSAKPEEDYTRLILKLQADSAVAYTPAHVDKALYAAHYISTLIAALAFIAMLLIVSLSFFPDLIQG